jgi:hypothetical protein
VKKASMSKSEEKAFQTEGRKNAKVPAGAPLVGSRVYKEVRLLIVMRAKAQLVGKDLEGLPRIMIQLWLYNFDGVGSKWKVYREKITEFVE